MARIALNCSCGWNFFIPGSTPGHEVNCPSCAQTVRIPGRKPGQDVPLTAGAIAAEKQRQQKMIRLIIVGGIAVVIVAGIILAFSLGGSAPVDAGAGAGVVKEKDPFAISTKPGKSTGSAGGGAGSIDLPPPPPPTPPLYTSAQVQELRHGVYSGVWMINMTTLISECMRFRNLTNEWAQLQADVANHDTKIKYNLGELAKVGEKVALESYLAQGDQILGFAQRDFTAMKPGEAAQVLNLWINNWRAGPALEQVNIQRGEKRMTLYLEFPEETKELLSLIRYPALQMEGTPDSGVVTALVAIPADLLRDVNGGFDALPPGYRSYLNPSDRKKLEELIKSKKGSSDDIDWLKTRIRDEAIPSFQREADTIRSKVLELEPKLKENVASDVIYRKAGSKVEGQIVQETPEYVKVRGRGITVSIPRDEIQKIEKGKGAATEFPGRFAAAKGNLEKLADLLAWCTEKALRLEKEYVAYNILTLDASNDKARTAVGLGRPSMTPGQAAPPPKYPSIEGTARIDNIDRAVEVIATDVTSRIQVFGDVVTEMRRRTESLTTSVPPMTPDKSVKGAAVIGNPLNFKPSELTVPTALEIGSWWSTLSPEDRRQFAKYFGLWCAYTRGLKK